MAESSMVTALSLLDKIADDLMTAKDELTTLDAALGDGDLGRTVERGFNAVKAEIPRLRESETDLGKALYRLGKVFGDAGASSFGALTATAFMKVGLSLKGKEALSLADVTNALQAAIDALMARGKAQIGDKTMLDALQPAVDAMRAAGESATPAQVIRAAAGAALAGAEHTKSMRSLAGRASWQGERSIGHMDGGAYAVALMFDSAARHSSV